MIIPSPFKIELIRIAIIKIGEKYLIKITYSFSLLNFSVEELISSVMVLVLIIYPTKIQVSNATTGINTLLERKSHISRMLNPFIEI